MPEGGDSGAGAGVGALVERLLDRRAGRTAFGFARGGVVDLAEQAALVATLVRHGASDVALELARAARGRVERVGPHRAYDARTGAGVGEAWPDGISLVEGMQPLEAPDVLRRPVQLLRVESVAADDQLRALYGHPDARDVAPAQVEVTTTPDDVVERLRSGAGGVVARGCALPAALERLGAFVAEVRGAEAAYPRFCDIGVLATAWGLEPAGWDVRIRWTPDVHYFTWVSDGQQRWVADLAGGQFLDHPASRPPLLLERARLLLAGGAEATPLLEQTRYAVDAVRLAGPPWRFDGPERAAFGRLVDRHAAAIAGVACPPGYREWLAALDPRRGVTV